MMTMVCTYVFFLFVCLFSDLGGGWGEGIGKGLEGEKRNLFKDGWRIESEVGGER